MLLTSSIYPISLTLDPTGTVSSVTVTKNGSNYTTHPTVTLSGGGGTGATAGATLEGGVTSYTLTNKGTGYVVATPPNVAVVGGDGAGATAVAVVDGQVTGVTVTNVGINYTQAAASLSGGGGTGATISVVTFQGKILSMTVTNGGTGYTSAPTLTVHEVGFLGDGTGGTATTSISILVSAVNVTTLGTGYTTAPTVTIDPPTSGVTATATANVSRYVLAIGVIDPGSGYGTAPAVIISGGGGAGAEGTATIVSPTIASSTNILASDLVILPQHVSPGGGGTIRLVFGFTFGVSPATVSIFKNGFLKGNVNADNSTNIITDGYYRFDIDVEAGDNLNFQASQTITAIREMRVHLVQFGA